MLNFFSETLVTLFIIPTVGFFVIMFSSKNLREIALFVSVLEFLESLRLWTRFDYVSSDFQFSFKVFWTSDYSFFFGVDGISLFFIILTTLLIPICLLAFINASGRIFTIIRKCTINFIHGVIIFLFFIIVSINKVLLCEM